LFVFLVLLLSGCTKNETLSIDNVNGIVIGLEAPFKVEMEIIKTTEKLASVLNMVNNAKKSKTGNKNIEYDLKMLIYLNGGNIITVYWDSDTDKLYMKNREILYEMESQSLNKYFEDLYNLGVQKIKITFPEVVYSNRLINKYSMDRMVIKEVPEVSRKFAETYAISDLNPNFKQKFMDELLSKIDVKERELLEKVLQSLDDDLKGIPYIPARIERVRYYGVKSWLISINWADYEEPEDEPFSSNSYLKQISHILVSDDGKILYKSTSQ